MPRNISFALTTDQFRARTKTVTRRMGWTFAKVGDVLEGVEKSQGLKKGEKVVRLGRIRLIDVRREYLLKMVDLPVYGQDECIKEGFPPPHEKSSPKVFVAFFRKTHRCGEFAVITRLEYEYL